VGRVVSALGERRVFALGLLLSAFGLGGAALTRSVPGFLLFLVPYAIGSALCTPVLASLISRTADSDTQGTVQGAASAIESLGRTVGPVWGTAVLQHVGGASAFGTSAALFASAMLFFLGTRQRGDVSSRAAA